jgi:hypothetical protein
VTQGRELHEQVHRSLGSYLAGSLEPAERIGVEQHLAGCALCREELTRLTPLPGLLARLSPEDFAIGEPEAGPDLLPVIIGRVRRERLRGQRRLWEWRAAAGLAAAAAVVAVIGLPGPQRPVGQQLTLAPNAAGAMLRGRATLTVKPWGTAIELTLGGLPAGADCVVYTVASDGHRQLAGEWGPTADRTVVVTAATSTPRDDLVEIIVATAGGRTLLTAETLPQRL